MRKEPMQNVPWLLYDHTLEDEEVTRLAEAIAKAAGAEPVTHPFNTHKRSFDDDATLFVMVDDDAFVRWLPHIAEREVTVVPLPYARNPQQQSFYGVGTKPEETIAAAFAENPATLQSYLRCNGEATLACATLGETEWAAEKGRFALMRRLFGIRLKSFVLTTAGGQEIKTAALMVEAGHEALLTRRRPRFFKSADNQCRRAAAVVYAPQSILGAMRQRLVHAARKSEEAESLPPGIGTLKAPTITVAGGDDRKLQLLCNGTVRETQKAVFESVETTARFLAPGITCAGGEAKESLRTQNLPTDNDLIAFFTKKTLPLVPIASEEAFAELFTKLRDSARITTAYALLLIVSVLMATTGLFQNSSPTIIGAMILAPLMAPIIAFAMGAVRFDDALLSRSVKTILISTFVALAASALLAWALPFKEVTEQMQMRTHPTLLDLAVAVLAGIAAAYGYTHSKVGESLAGVAIAVALVPPLCVAGIGAGYGDWHIFTNAFLLYLANIVGIVVASGVVFYLLGYASRKYASAAFFVKLLMIAAIAVPLWLSTRTVVADARIYDTFEKLKEVRIGDTTAHLFLRGVVHKEGGTYAVIYVITHRNLGESQRKKVAEAIKKRLGPDVHLIFTYQELYE